ncbi:DUF4232 domain-containing protein [Parafrankia sp. EUN1f]|uniref:DUF4232 domain-containing protein n=1 Tax=Parafrankia sp. EUN1f TaxID=102897 RepID=UPI0001C4670B|nr:DUF4232 domain-containing protein [Parafrankia sp. EUN1f]EFC83535.1 hypothetical protein FrEUN1fDRAFT_3331 [Parafrankia sp. EUN1f]
MRTPPGRPARLRLVAVMSLAVSIAASVAGCGDAGDSTDSASASVPTSPGASAAVSVPALTPPPTSSVAGTAPSTSASTAASGGASGDVPACAAAGLTAAVDDLQGAAGHIYGRLVLTNTGSAPCVVAGFPGVSVVDEAGRQIGAAADRNGPSGAPVTLAPGGRAGATLAITQPGLLPGCESTDETTRGTRLRVYPPDDRASLLAAVPGGVQTCRDPAVHQLTVSALEPV